MVKTLTYAVCFAKRNLILAVLSTGFLFAGSSLLFGEVNLVKNGGFEESDVRLVQDIQELIKLGWDFNQGDAPFADLPSYWNPNPAMAPGKIQLIKEKKLAYEGEACLLVESNEKGSQFYQESNPAVAKYEYSFAAKGKGSVSFTMYMYGSTPEGKVTHLGGPKNSVPVHEISISTDEPDKWNVYTGTLEITNPEVKATSPVLIIFGGPVYLDAVKLIEVK